MPYFKDKTTEKITLATDEHYWVEIASKLTWGDMKTIAKSGDGSSFTHQADAVLLSLIVAWNLDDEQGNILPINQENIDKLDREDIEKIIHIAGGKVEEPESSKKASSPAS